MNDAPPTPVAPVPSIQETPLPASLTPEVTPTPAAPAPMPPQPKKPLPKNFVIVGAVVFVILIVVLVYLQALQNKPVAQLPAPTPAPLATPTPMRILTPIATTSAFMSFHESVASLSATINGFSFVDGTLTPPVLDLDLGL